MFFHFFVQRKLDDIVNKNLKPFAICCLKNIASRMRNTTSLMEPKVGTCIRQKWPVQDNLSVADMKLIMFKPALLLEPSPSPPGSAPPTDPPGSAVPPPGSTGATPPTGPPGSEPSPSPPGSAPPTDPPGSAAPPPGSPGAHHQPVLLAVNHHLVPLAAHYHLVFLLATSYSWCTIIWPSA
ncbi:formin-like protein 16 [Vitis riparia]|uniref:formin-like protein 16 n=1 Tax=Vitis riparia TaxID=96939 RepID=UPI00155AB38C|nr:formin-like protein 16 [Vitis riparia]